MFMTLLNHVSRYTYRYRLPADFFASVTTFTHPLQCFPQLDGLGEDLLKFPLLTSDMFFEKNTQKYLLLQNTTNSA